MHEEIKRVKRRQQQRVKQLRMQVRDSLPPFLHELHDPIEEPVSRKEISWRDWSSHDDWSHQHRPNRLGIQLLCSILLAGFAYLIFQSSFPLPEAVRTTARDAMTRDFNFEGVAVWYETRFGQPPSILSFKQTKRDVPVHSPKQASLLQFPSSWQLVNNFDPDSAKVVIKVDPSGQIVNGETGWVRFVGEQSGFGTTIIVQLSDQREAWYGNLDIADVNVNDWIYAGQVLGTASQDKEGNRYMYLALRERDVFINPLDVISFD